MSFPYYRSATDGAVGEVDLPPPWRSRVGDVKGYQPEPGLVDAVNVALALGQPLLLTGEPGTGKTQLAWHVTWQVLGTNSEGKPREPLVFEAKSTSNSRELFYSYDTLGRFHKAKEGSARNIDYITYNLGRDQGVVFTPIATGFGIVAMFAINPRTKNRPCASSTSGGQVGTLLARSDRHEFDLFLPSPARRIRV